MNFKELLLQAKFGDRTATTELLMLYQPLLLKESIIDGILDEDRQCRSGSLCTRVQEHIFVKFSFG